MSRTTEQNLVASPVTKYLTWKTLKEIKVIEGEEIEKLKGGGYTWYNKETEKNEEVKIERFAVLNLSVRCFKGYDEARKRGVWSNSAIKPEHIVTVRAKDEKILSFPLKDYKLHKDTLKGYGAKYTVDLLVAIETEDGKWEIVSMLLSGAQLTGAPADAMNPTAEEKQLGWFNFSKTYQKLLYKNFVNLGPAVIKKKGQSKFAVPRFEIGEQIDAETSGVLNELDKQLVEYFDAYFARQVVDSPVAKEDAGAPLDVDDDDDSLTY